jgi:hypothetical protein
MRIITTTDHHHYQISTTSTQGWHTSLVWEIVWLAKWTALFSYFPVLYSSNSQVVVRWWIWVAMPSSEWNRSWPDSFEIMCPGHSVILLSTYLPVLYLTVIQPLWGSLAYLSLSGRRQYSGVSSKAQVAQHRQHRTGSFHLALVICCWACIISREWHYPNKVFQQQKCF